MIVVLIETHTVDEHMTRTVVFLQVAEDENMISEATQTQVEIRKLRRHFGSVKAVDDIDFTFRGGEVHGFIGPNGAGKTTTMRIIATLDNPDTGDVFLNGKSISNYPDELRSQIGFMPDYLDAFPDMIVDDYLDFYARAYRLHPTYRKKRMATVIEFTGLGALLERPTTALSKGQKQRLSLARMLINDPKVLILDEPAAGLDPRARIELRSLIRKLADHGKAVFVSSHILSELSETCDAVTIIENGKICASDHVHNLQRTIDEGMRVVVHLERPDDAERERLQRELSQMPHVMRTMDEMTGCTFLYEGETAVRVAILQKLLAQGFLVSDFHAASTDLEDAFMRLTIGGNAE